MNASEIAQLQAYMTSTFGNDRLSVKKRPKASDSVEVELGNEFIGIIYKDEDEGEVSYQFHMTILEEDLSTL